MFLEVLLDRHDCSKFFDKFCSKSRNSSSPDKSFLAREKSIKFCLQKANVSDKIDLPSAARIFETEPTLIPPIFLDTISDNHLVVSHSLVV